jgi:hypothetical protein
MDSIFLSLTGDNKEDTFEKIITLLLKHEVDLTTISLLLSLGINSNVLWEQLVFQGIYSVELIQLLLDHKADIHLKSHDTWTALMLACQDKSCPIDVIKLLLEHDDDLNIINKDGWTAFMIACVYNDISVVQLFIDYHADINWHNDYTALSLTCINNKNDNKLGIIKLLLEHGALITNYTVKFYYQSPVFVKLFLDHGFHINPNTILNTKTKELVLSYCTNDELIKHGSLGIEEIYKRIKVEKLKTRYYERVLRGIPEHNAIIRYKPGNMGHKICQAEFFEVIDDDIMIYLNASKTNIKEKIEDYLYNH